MMTVKAVVSHSMFLLLCGLLVTYEVCGQGCGPGEISDAMLSCQEERQSLSHASRTNNTSQLCNALQKYSECISPKVGSCRGETLTAIQVIRQQYAGSPYNCHITDSRNDLDGQAANDLDSQLVGHEDNNIIPYGVTDTLGGETEPSSPSQADPTNRPQATSTPDTTSSSSSSSLTTAAKDGVSTPTVNTTTHTSSAAFPACSFSLLVLLVWIF